MDDESFIGAFGDVPTDLAGDYSQLYIFRAEDFGAWYRRVRNAHEREVDAAKDWNVVPVRTVHGGRTCHVTFERIFDGHPYKSPHCSECGQFFAGYVRGKWPRYCPNCGARVVTNG